MPDLTLDHPAVEAASKAWGDSAPTTTAMWAGMSEHRRDLVRARMTEALKVALPHLTEDDLRDTPVGQALIREGIAAARNLEWMRPRMTPGGHIFNPAIPGDELRAVREEALAREAMQNMRESEQGRALMAEAWRKFQEHYAAEWEEAYPEDIFPSPAPPPAVVSRESVAASMMRQWAKNLRADHNPFEEDNA